MIVNDTECLIEEQSRHLNSIQKIIDHWQQRKSARSDFFSFELPDGAILPQPCIEADKLDILRKEAVALLDRIKEAIEISIFALQEGDLLGAFRCKAISERLTEQFTSGYYGSHKEDLDNSYNNKLKQQSELSVKTESLTILKHVAIGIAKSNWQADANASIKEVTKSIYEEFQSNSLFSLQGGGINLPKYKPKEQTIRKWIKEAAPEDVRLPGRPPKV